MPGFFVCLFYNSCYTCARVSGFQSMLLPTVLSGTNLVDTHRALCWGLVTVWLTLLPAGTAPFDLRDPGGRSCPSRLEDVMTPTPHQPATQVFSLYMLLAAPPKRPHTPVGPLHELACILALKPDHSSPPGRGVALSPYDTLDPWPLRVNPWAGLSRLANHHSNTQEASPPPWL